MFLYNNYVKYVFEVLYTVIVLCVFLLYHFRKYKMSSTELSLIERLRKENLDQYFTLVRMHLSFLVDINTDDVDCSTDKPKQFRWNFHKKTKNSGSNSSQNNTKSNELHSITEEGILRLNELIDFLSKAENVTQEGIFRRTGSLSRQQELRQLLLTGSNLGLDEGRFSVHDCASVLKGFLAELPQPLLMDQYYQTYCTLATQYPPNAESSETKLLTALQLLLLLLTPLHRSFLERLLTLLRLVADNEASNRMSPDTLATMFTPHLLCPRKLSPEALHADAVALAPVVSFMIREAARLFLAPARLATDAAAYCRRRDARASDGDLDESITDKTAASTVYTFVDRHRTSAENATNPTDAALARLYAHIHALPDSQHKRRLIKHFNRQNGYGTPIQIQRTGKAAGSRSFGDSIKRHIFNKGLLNRTPKKGSASTINTIEEKSQKGKLRFTDDSKVDVSHKNIVLKNLANKIASSESLDDNQDYESDASNESTLSEGAISRTKKLSPKFVSEPNLSSLDSHDETPKNPKKRGTRLFRSKILSASQNLNRKYQKRGAIRSTPTCVSCFDEQDTGSENDASNADTNKDDIPLLNTPKKDDVDMKLYYLTSTPGVSDAVGFDEDCATPFTVNFRRASMSPITKSTQKLSKAMQESIMTPRSRKPLIITSEQRDSLPETNENKEIKPEPMYQSMSPNNDSDFVSSDDENMSRSSFSCERSNTSANTSNSRKPYDARSLSVGDASPLRSENTRFVISHERPKIVQDDLNTTLCGSEVGAPLPKFQLSQEPTNTSERTESLTEPFGEYLMSRSVLTATPIDLSILNKSSDTDDRITDSMLYCLDGNVPTDLTLSISNLAMDRETSMRSPLKNVNSVHIESPGRKRSASSIACSKEELPCASGSKKPLVDKENVAGKPFEIRETEL